MLWFKLAELLPDVSNKANGSGGKTKATGFGGKKDYQKAIDLKKGAASDKDPKAGENLAAYYNNLAEASAKSNKVDDAVKTSTGGWLMADRRQYYFDTGAVLTNAGKVDDAIAAFDQVIAADPNRPTPTIGKA